MMFDQQLDLDGRAHDLAPAHEQPKLFDSAPGIRGQIALDTDQHIVTVCACCLHDFCADPVRLEPYCARCMSL